MLLSKSQKMNEKEKMLLNFRSKRCIILMLLNWDGMGIPSGKDSNQHEPDLSARFIRKIRF